MTKFLIVACAVLCLLLSALTVSYSANADRINDSLKSERALRQAVEAEQKAVQAQAGEERAALTVQIEALNNAIKQRDASIAQLQMERTDLTSAKEKATAELAGIQNRISQLAATAETLTSINKGYRDEVGTLRTDQLAASRREIELNDRLNDLTSQNEVLEQTARALREQLAEVQLAMQNAASGVKTGAKGQPFDPSGLRVRGTLTDVIKTDAGDELGVIDIGSNKGVQENMRLNIIRGGEFLATIVITKADPGQSVGRINRMGLNKSINRGDTISSQLQ